MTNKRNYNLKLSILLTLKLKLVNKIQYIMFIDCYFAYIIITRDYNDVIMQTQKRSA